MARNNNQRPDQITVGEVIERLEKKMRMRNNQVKVKYSLDGSQDEYVPYQDLTHNPGSATGLTNSRKL